MPQEPFLRLPQVQDYGSADPTRAALLSDIVVPTLSASSRTGLPDRRSGDREAEIGARIRTLRRARGWTQEQLAASCRVTRSAIAQWESGRAGQQAHNLAAVAQALSVSVDTLRHGGRLVNDPQIADDERHLLSMFRHCSPPQKDCLLIVARALTGLAAPDASAPVELIVAPAGGLSSAMGGALARTQPEPELVSVG